MKLIAAVLLSLAVSTSFAQGKMEMKNGMKDDKMMKKEGSMKKDKMKKDRMKKDGMMNDGMMKK